MYILCFLRLRPKTGSPLACRPDLTFARVLHPRTLVQCINVIDLAEHGRVKIRRVRQLHQHHHDSGWPSPSAGHATDPPLTTSRIDASSSSGGRCPKNDPEVFAALIFSFQSLASVTQGHGTLTLYWRSANQKDRAKIFSCFKLENKASSRSAPPTIAVASLYSLDP